MTQIIWTHTYILVSKLAVHVVATGRYLKGKWLQACFYTGNYNTEQDMLYHSHCKHFVILKNCLVKTSWPWHNSSPSRPQLSINLVAQVTFLLPSVGLSEWVIVTASRNANVYGRGISVGYHTAVSWLYICYVLIHFEGSAVRQWHSDTVTCCKDSYISLSVFCSYRTHRQVLMKFSVDGFF